VRLVGADASSGTIIPRYERGPVDVVERVTELTGRERDLILGGNAMRLLKLNA
jgi:hypothetical protein